MKDCTQSTQKIINCSKSRVETPEKRYETSSKLTIKTLKLRRRCSGIFIGNFEHIFHFFLVFVLLTLNKYLFTGYDQRTVLVAVCYGYENHNLNLVFFYYATSYYFLTISCFGKRTLHILLTHSFPMHPFSTPRNIRKPLAFLMFSGGRERVHWERMG